MNPILMQNPLTFGHWKRNMATIQVVGRCHGSCSDCVDLNTSSKPWLIRQVRSSRQAIPNPSPTRSKVYQARSQVAPSLYTRMRTGVETYMGRSAANIRSQTYRPTNKSRASKWSHAKAMIWSLAKQFNDYFRGWHLAGKGENNLGSIRKCQNRIRYEKRAVSTNEYPPQTVW